MEKLHFIKTLSIEDFKTMQGVEQIQIKQNAQTGKCFFIYGVESGPVSEKFLNGGLTNPVISEVCSPDTGDIFFMLHQRGEGGAATLATF